MKTQGEQRHHGRSSLILYLSREEDQTTALSKGVVVNGEHFPVFLYSPRLQIPQCYNCSLWGHTQASCRAQVACGYCAKSHNTRECTVRNDEKKRKCANCSGSHASWQKSKCPKWKQRVQQRESLRVSLVYEQARRLGAMPPTPDGQAEPQKAQERQTNKRQRQGTVSQPSQPTPTQNEKTRGAGRPRWTEGQAGPFQPTIGAVLGARREEREGEG